MPSEDRSTAVSSFRYFKTKTSLSYGRETMNFEGRASEEAVKAQSRWFR